MARRKKSVEDLPVTHLVLYLDRSELDYADYKFVEEFTSKEDAVNRADDLLRDPDNIVSIVEVGAILQPKAAPVQWEIVK